MGAFLIDLLQILFGVIIGGIIGFIAARKYMEKYMANELNIAENALNKLTACV